MSAAKKKSGAKSGTGRKEKGGFVLGLIVGLLLGLAIALGAALYITKVPIPFVNKVPQRTAEQDAAETERNRNWDPNAPLAGKNSARSVSGAVLAPAPQAAPAPQDAASEAAPAPKAAGPAASAAKPGAAPAAKPASAATNAAANTATNAAATASIFFVQAGAYTRNEDAEAQRAKLALQGFAAQVMEREQSGRPVFRVRLGPLDSRDAAVELQHKVEEAGFETNLVRVQK